VFGFPNLVRFSWSTCRDALNKSGACKVKWFVNTSIAKYDKLCDIVLLGHVRKKKMTQEVQTSRITLAKVILSVVYMNLPAFHTNVLLLIIGIQDGSKSVKRMKRSPFFTSRKMKLVQFSDLKTC